MYGVSTPYTFQQTKESLNVCVRFQQHRNKNRRAIHAAMTHDRFFHLTSISIIQSREREGVNSLAPMAVPVV
jgi:hypothetical protein